MKSEINLRNKIKDIKQVISNLNQEEGPVKLTKVTSCKFTCQRENIRSPIIIEKSSNQRQSKVNKTSTIMEIPQSSFYSPRQSKMATTAIEKFEPIDIPQRKPKNLENLVLEKNKSQEIEIRIEETNKQCIKKLFKKIHKLTDDLTQCQKQKALLELELKNLKSLPKNINNDEFYKKLQIDNHKLKLQIQNLLQRLEFQKIKPPVIIQKIVEKPIQIIKQIPVEKIVEVKIQVPKYIPGPQRIVEKIIQVPKYIEVDRPRSPRQSKVRQIIKTVPEIVEKLVYIDKPVYIDRIVEKQVKVPVQVPIQVPVYVNQPNQNNKAEFQNLLFKLSHFESEFEKIMFDNQNLRKENRLLFENIEVLKRHNEEKNRQVEGLIRSDYDNRRGISIIREVSGLPSSDFSNSLQNAYSLTSKNFVTNPLAF